MTTTSGRLKHAVFGALFACTIATGAAADDKPLIHYNSNSPDFWKHPPPDWFYGDENKSQQGLRGPVGPALPVSMSDLQANLKRVKLPPGFKIDIWAQGVQGARQMAWGDKGTLFVGSFLQGVVSAVVEENGHKTVKTILKGLVLPTGIAFHNGALYVGLPDKILKYENAEANLDKMPAPKIAYDDMPGYIPHGWKYLVVDKDGWLYVPFGPPCNECLPPTSVAQIRRVNPENGTAQLIAIGVRNSVGGDVDPRTGEYWFSENARDWISDDLPADKLNHVARLGENFGYPYCHQGDLPDPKFAMGHKCSEFSPPAAKLGPHVAPLGMKFYTGDQFPPSYKNNILLAEHGSWNRHKYLGARIMRIEVSKDGKHAKQTVFAEGWLVGPNNYLGRPDDIIMAKDGSILVADDWAGAIYRISYDKKSAASATPHHATR
jgi:glucose/arabinose dehydrogenase